MNKNLMFSSASDEWGTPQDFFDKLNLEFHFTLDVCASKENAKCKKYFDKKTNGLRQKWSGICWMNPPYGRNIGDWIFKARQSSMEGSTVVCLVPARTYTNWWHSHCMKGEIRFVKGRLKFGGCKNAAPFPCAIVIFRKK